MLRKPSLKLFLLKCPAEIIDFRHPFCMQLYKITIMSATDEIQYILKRSEINMGMIFIVQDQKGRTHNVPIFGIISCLETVSLSIKVKILKSCRLLSGNPKELLKYMKYLALCVASRKL